MKYLLICSALALASSTTSAQVADWRMIKGPIFQQTANNTQPASPVFWTAEVIVETTGPGDATSITVTGGGIPGSLALTQSGTEWYLDVAYPNQAALNAVFPSSTTYTVTLSGGTLGTLVQQVPFGPEVYPNVPYLTGTVFTGLQSMAPEANFPMTWSDPGPLTQNSGCTGMVILDQNDNIIYEEITPGGTTQATIPNCALAPNRSYLAYLEFTIVTVVSGAGGFGPSGTADHNGLLDFTVDTLAGPAAVETTRLGSPPNPNALQPGMTSGPVIGNTWDPFVDHTSFAPTAFIDLVAVDLGAPINVPLSFGTLLCSPPPAKQIFFSPAGLPFSITVPNLCTLVGQTACAQGGSVLPGPSIVLANALDIVFGM